MKCFDSNIAATRDIFNDESLTRWKVRNVCRAKAINVKNMVVPMCNFVAQCSSFLLHDVTNCTGSVYFNRIFRKFWILESLLDTVPEMLQKRKDPVNMEFLGVSISMYSVNKVYWAYAILIHQMTVIICIRAKAIISIRRNQDWYNYSYLSSPLPVSLVFCNG